MTEENGIDNGAKTPTDHHQSKLMQFIMSEEAASVQTLIDGDEEGQTVMDGDYTINYEIFTLKGVEARINIDLFETMPERLSKMQSEEDEKTGKKKYTKDDVNKFIKKWCFNKVKANDAHLPTDEDFIVLRDFVEEIVFNEDAKLRVKPPTGIKKSKAVSKYKTWETKKFKVKIPVDAFVNLENKVRKLRKKGLKKDAMNLQAETEKVAFLQNHMNLKPGEFCSGPEFAAYYKELYNAMFPSEFGMPDKDDDEKEKKDKKEKTLHRDQKKLPEDKKEKKKSTKKKS